MCGRFTLKNKNEIKELYDVDIVPSYNISPSSDVVVLADGPKIMRWSYSPSWAKAPMNIINARIETLDEKPSFKEARRCIFLTDGWYEWKRWFDWKRRENNKVPYYHTMNNEIIHIAGIYNPSGCAIVTQQSIGVFKNIHHRQPVLLSNHEMKEWLAGTNILNSKVSDSIDVYKVGNYVNSAKNNDSRCIEKE